MSNRAKIVAIPTTTTTTFSPTSVAACALWLDGADPAGNGVVPANGTTITTWADKSGNSANGTAAGGAITYNLSAKGLTFNGSYFSLPNNTISPGAANYTIFCVVKPTIISNYPYLWFAGTGGPAGQAMSLVFYPTGEVENGFWTDFMGIAPAGTVAINNTYLFSSAYNGAVVGRVLYKNGTSVVSGTPTTTKNTQASSSVSIGGGSALTGIYHELIVFNSFLGTSQRQNVEAYLAQKWGLTSYLPAGHPGLTTSVYIQTVALAAARQKIRTIPRAGVTTTFLPTSIAGCQLWLDAADQTTITGTTTMTSWRDKSTNAYTANSFVNSVAYPSWVSNLQNGNGAVQYTAGNGTSIANFVLAQTMSIFEVYYLINQTNGFFLEHGPDENATSGFYLWPSGGQNFAINNGSGQIYVNFGSISVANTWQMIQGINPDPSNSNTMAFYFNGTVKASGSTQSGTTTVTKTLYINGRGGANSVSYNAYLGELIIFNTALSATNRQTIESYLAQKWGITSSLPVAHPGLTTTVYGTVAAAPTVRQKIRILPPPAPLVSYTQAFAYTGANQTFSVPATTTSITVYMWGAGGAGGYSGVGGAGAYLQGVLSVTPSSSLTVIVGQGGTVNGTSAFGGGGVGSVGGWTGGGGGGGYSGIFNSSTPLAIVGAGGGAAFYSAVGGCGDSVTGTGIRGTTNGSVQSGYGGTQSAGGAGGTGGLANGSAGIYLRGGAGDPAWSSGGGSGYYGGGGGGTDNGIGGSGAGGSSYSSLLTSIVASNSPNTGMNAPNTSSTYYASGVAVGGSGYEIVGGNGRVVLVYMG